MEVIRHASLVNLIDSIGCTGITYFRDITIVVGVVVLHQLLSIEEWHATVTALIHQTSRIKYGTAI